MLIAIRHAAPLTVGICAGRYEIPVLDAQPEVERILECLQGWSIDFIYCSPALRCRAVADLLAPRLVTSVHSDSRLRELHFGQWEGHRWTEIQAEDRVRFDHWCRHWLEASPPGGEKVSELECRVREWLTDAPKSNVLVCAHAGTIRALNVVVRGKTWHAAMSTEVPYLVPIVVR